MIDCIWCATEFNPRSTGGKPQRFCSTPCRRAFDIASRKWISGGIENGTITVAELRNTSVATRALGTAQIITFPVAKAQELENAPSESNTADGA